MNLKYFILFFLVTATLKSVAQGTQIKYLSGTDKDNTVLWDFMCSKGRNSGTWGKIPVPSNWEFHGYGTYNYGWEENLKENETGYYRHTFKSQPEWKNKTVRIVFEASMTDTEVKINGKPAGPIHQGSFYRFKYDITKLLKPGAENLLEVKVNKISSDTSVNRAERQSDYWVFGSIYRPVYLEILPTQFIDWTAIDAKADGSFSIDVYPIGIRDANRVEAQIKTLSGEPVGKPFSVPVKRGEEKVVLKTSIDKPKTWTSEFPNRYQVEVRLMNAKGTVHTINQKFGFRTVELREGDGFYVNGQKIMFKGVNRHSAWPTSGRTLSRELSEMDVKLIKEMNMNAVRMSHYPPDGHFLEVCDSLGLYVIDELAGWQKKYDTPVGRKLVKAMIMKDVNHPSIVMWANGNEGGNNHELVDDYAKYDPQKRVVIHPWNIFRGTDTQHYKGYDCCAGSLFNGSQVFFPTEMLHGVFDGGHGAGLNDHWNLMLQNPLSAGGFLWVFADEGVVRDDKDGWIDVKDNRAPDGILGPYREKEGSFYTIREIWSPVYVESKMPLAKFNGTIKVENRYHFTNLNQVKFKVETKTLPLPFSTETGKTIFQNEFIGPDLAPWESKVIKIQLPDNYREADVLYLTAIDPHGQEIFTWSWPLKSTREVAKTIFESGAQGKVAINETQSQLTLSANGVEVRFDKSTGLIVGAKNETSTISFTNGPVLAEGKAEFKSLRHYPQGANYVVEISSSGNFTWLRYTMAPNGILRMDYGYSLYNHEGKNEYDYMGLSFDYPEEKVKGVKYLGYGPYRVWKNRMKGGCFNVWDKPYNNTVTGESWDYPEFKGYYRDMYWVVIENSESPFAIFTETDNLFLRLYTPKKPEFAGNDFTSPPFPKGNISFLNGISAIGTKFDSGANHGPEGQKNKVSWAGIHGTLYFDFSGGLNDEDVGKN